mmetsp:Transcript_2157/g.7538  ORF Transcript_2157/g.7538 Transcript_2157/m.7538 type:complete len:268 (+) Transcript_2157:1081-1884(+)
MPPHRPLPPPGGAAPQTTPPPARPARPRPPPRPPWPAGRHRGRGGARAPWWRRAPPPPPPPPPRAHRRGVAGFAASDLALSSSSSAAAAAAAVTGEGRLDPEEVVTDRLALAPPRPLPQSACATTGRRRRDAAAARRVCSRVVGAGLDAGVWSAGAADGRCCDGLRMEPLHAQPDPNRPARREAARRRQPDDHAARAQRPRVGRSAGGHRSVRPRLALPRRARRVPLRVAAAAMARGGRLCAGVAEGEPTPRVFVWRVRPRLWRLLA